MKRIIKISCAVLIPALLAVFSPASRNVKAQETAAAVKPQYQETILSMPPLTKDWAIMKKGGPMLTGLWIFIL